MASRRFLCIHASGNRSAAKDPSLHPSPPSTLSTLTTLTTPSTPSTLHPHHPPPSTPPLISPPSPPALHSFWTTTTQTIMCWRRDERDPNVLRSPSGCDY